VESGFSSEAWAPEAIASGAGSPQSSRRTSSARIDQEVIFEAVAFLAFLSRPVVDCADEAAFDQDVRSFLYGFERVFGKTRAANTYAVPFGLGGPFVVGVLRRSPGSNGQNGQFRAAAFNLRLFRLGS
jgi:hypothetical protein